MAKTIKIQAANSIGFSVCACGCGQVRLELADDKQRIFATASISLEQVHELYDEAKEEIEKVNDALRNDQYEDETGKIKVIH